MFYLLSKTIYLLAMPMSWLCILLGYAWITKSSRKKNIAIFLGIALLFTSANPLLVNRLLLWWEVPPTKFADIEQPYELGIILTGVVNSNKSPYDRVHVKTASGRVIQSAELYHRGLVKQFVITGSYAQPRGTVADEATDLYHLLRLCQVPDSVITLETKALNTNENAAYTADLLKEEFPDLTQKPLLITSAFHMRRSQACFIKQGIETDPFSVDFMTYDIEKPPLDSMFWPKEESFFHFRVWVHEVVGLLVYKLMGYA